MVLGDLLIVVTEQLIAASTAEIKGYSILLLTKLQDVKMNHVLFMSERRIKERSSTTADVGAHTFLSILLLKKKAQNLLEKKKLRWTCQPVCCRDELVIRFEYYG